MRNKLYAACLCCLLGMFKVNAGFAQLRAAHLRCGYLNDPVGIAAKTPRLSWRLVTDEKDVLQTAYEIRAARTASDLGSNARLLWHTGKVRSDQSLHIPYAGPALSSRERVYWQVRVWDNRGHVSKWSKPAYWEMGLLKTADWKASWITPGFKEDIHVSNPCPYFRKVFMLKKKIRSARIYATSLGDYALFLDGKKVGHRLFTPGWTDYNKRIQYQAYDVTKQLSEGDHAIGAILGDGWYRGHAGWQKNNRNRYGTKLALLLQLEVTYRDGSRQTFVSDRSWKVTTGAVRTADHYDGETYDARKELTGWTTASYDDGRWKPVQLLDHTKDVLVASASEPVRKIQEIKPVAILTTPQGGTVIDMGQNMVGWVRLKVRGQRGDTVKLKFAEVLDKAGNFYTANLRSAKSTDTYILKGAGEETYEPHFTFHGFRYVKVEGYPGQLNLHDLTGVVIHSAIQPTGRFSCSDSLINQLWHNIIWSQKGNFLDVPTDCPQRDERLGWTGDAEVFFPTAAYNYNVAAFFKKWLKDLAADQWDNGMVPDVIPDILNMRQGQGVRNRRYSGGSTGWGDAAVVIPWNLYLYYGDKKVLETQYQSMAGWIRYMKDRAGADLLWTGDKQYGDWLSFSSNRSDYPGAYTDKDLIATAYFAHAADLMSRAASVLGRQKDARKYAALFKSIKKAFNEAYVTLDGYLVSNTQTAYALAIKFHLLPKEKVPIAADHLADNVKLFGHITTGFLGTPIICPVLTMTGYDSLAYMLLNRKQYPSWLYPVTKGATTIWERWDGIKPDGSFQSASMNSFNHYAYGAIGEWLYSVVAGIKLDPGQAGFKHFYLEPHPGGGLTHAEAGYECLYGAIVSDWHIENGKMIYQIQVPPNTTARVTLPHVASAVYSGGGNIKNDASVRHIERRKDALSFEVGSGKYTFTYSCNVL